ncbi:RHS repeat-associated core domain-containing protein [Spirosoma jeollabukense]
MYDGLGTKLHRTVKTAGSVTLTQDYLGGIELKNNVVEAVYNEEGRAYNTGSGYRYEYVLRDHLGNTRLVFTDKNGSGSIDNSEILSEAHYYPFGRKMDGAWYSDASAGKYRYQYNGKELIDEFDLNFYDYGARWYDPGMGSWWEIDPLAEVSRRWSPYVFSNNNPLRFVDPDGRNPGDIIIYFTGAAFSSVAGNKDVINNIRSAVSISTNYATQVVYRTDYGYATDKAKAAFEEIQKQRQNNPNAKIVIYGYSYGGVAALELATRLNNRKMKTTLITVDAANGASSDKINRNVGDYIESFNFYELDPKVSDITGSKGGPNHGRNVTNIDKSKATYDEEAIDHMNIDESTMSDAINIINQVFNSTPEGGNKTLSGDEFRKKLNK